jgi:hypothetical protein
MAVPRHRPIRVQGRREPVLTLAKQHALRLLPTISLIVLSASSAFSQDEKNPYVMRLAHEGVTGTACVLLQEDGAFHYETGDRYNTRVYEGEVPSAQLREVNDELRELLQLSQMQIEEPLIHGPYDIVDVGFTQEGAWRELLFRTVESQAPYRKSLQPLLQWMYRLHKLPRRELSEDAGKRNCLPRRKLRLIPRDEFSEQPPTLKPGPGFASARPPLVPKTAQVTPLLQLGSLTRSPHGAHQNCVLVASNGEYRFEARTQSTGSKTVNTFLTKGQFAAEDLQTLQGLLNAPSLVNMRHHEPPGGMALNLMGSLLELYVSRGSGVQELILTDNTHRNTWFYAGDGDISRADPIVKFLREHVESNAMPATNAERNGCTELP